MENLQLTAEKILCHLRNIPSNKKKNLKIINLLEQVEKREPENDIQSRILEEIFQVFIKSTNSFAKQDDGILFGCIIWTTHLQERQKLPLLNESQFEVLYQWLLQKHQCCNRDDDETSKMIIAMERLLVVNTAIGKTYFISAIRSILKYVSDSNTFELLATSVQCMEKIMYSLRDVKLSDEQIEFCDQVGCRILQIFYDQWKIDEENINALVLILDSLQILNKIIALNSNFASMKAAELFGLAKCCFNFGVDPTNCLVLKPQKVCVSQQALYDSAEEIEIVINSENARNSGGKTPRTRKPRAVFKNAKPNDNNSALIKNHENRDIGHLFDLKVSDSEVSDPENSTNRILFERSRKAKIRLVAINIVGTLSRVLERRTLFGYWHALFPSGTAESNEDLLYIGQHDPNLRCRSTALQVCAQLLYGSKGFLHQAEMNAKLCPATFMPFSVSLGYTIRAIYKSLSTILSSESSLPVLTQALKCLAVLVQASPMQQFERGFVQSFVKDVKPLIYHRDPAIQVSALMVMEFLVALPEITCDIAEAVGLPPEIAAKKRNKLAHLDDKEIDIIDIEEFVESDDENFTCNNVDNTEKIDICSAGNTSWLLLRVLNNLTEHNHKVVSTSVRIESLQVLIAMSAHIAMVKSNFAKVAEVLIYSLSDALPDIRLYAARCVDACAYQISRYLFENASSPSEIEIQEYSKFWFNLMPIVIGHIRRDSEEMPTVRITLCDALSNIGVLMFENTKHSNQISLLSFLSGVSSDSTEDTIVRAAAVRALAMFSLYPSLRGDLVFIENTAELTLSLVKDPNLLVRIKSFWSLGNISDALIGKGTEIQQYRSERISDDLLFRLINVSITACNDNDKVRCNAVRTLGNLLRLLTDDHFFKNNKLNWLQTFEMAICKLTDCIRSSGNAKVKWNTCYAISNLLRNRTMFQISNLNWQETLFCALCHVIVHHSNFKVRINASIAITNITDRSHFGVYYERFWISVLEAIEQSYKLENFHEYNHRDNLQDQLCVALSHILAISSDDDLLMLRKHLLPHEEVIRNTWKRVINRMVPEKAAPLISCPVILLERKKLKESLSCEHKNAIEFLLETLKI